MRNKFYARAWRILRPIVLFFLPVELRGTENLEDEAAILCANHSSAWDPILLVLAMPQSFNLRIMAKKQLFSIPLVRWFLRNMGVFPVDRGNSDIGAVKTAISSLRDDWNLLIFPEGTRVKKPAGDAQERRWDDGHPRRSEDGTGVYRYSQAPVPQDGHHLRQALYAYLYGPQGNGGGVSGQHGRGHAPRL